MGEERKGLGSERGGHDEEDGPGADKRVVQDDTPYISALKARLGQDKKPKPQVPGTFDPQEETREPEKPAFVIYGDDGKPI